MTFQILTTPGGSCIGGILTPGMPGVQQSIAAPSGVGKLLKQVFGVGAGATPSGGGGSSSTPVQPPACDMFIGVVTESPSGGFGTGKVKRVKFNADGSWYSTGSDVAVVFPKV